MDNPLSEEQTKRLREIAKLGPEEQKGVLADFLSELKPEQVKFLQEQQGMQQCIFCNIASGNLTALKVYEDENVVGVLDINPASYGHVLLFPKKHYQMFSQMPAEEVGYLLKIGGILLAKVQEAVNAEGGNLFIANGGIAGQKAPHVLVHIIPRFKDDGMDFNWNGKKFPDEDMQKIAGLLGEKLKGVGKDEVEVKEPEVEEVEFEEDERIP